MLYIINGKPYVKVSNYYKEVSVEKKGNEFFVKPVGGEETRIENPNLNEISQVSVSTYYESKNKSKISSLKEETSLKDYAE